MYTRVKSTPNSPRKSVQIVESVRKGDKVSQEIVRHVGVASDDAELETLKVLAEQIIVQIKTESDRQLSLYAPESISRKSSNTDNPINVDLRDLREEQRIIEGIHEIGGKLFDELGFNTILSGVRNKGAAQVLKDVVLARLAQPVSKLRTAQLLEEDFGIRISVDHIYRMMDKLCGRIDRVKEQVAHQTMGLLGREVDVLLYDVTTLAFDSQVQDSLRDYGYSKDHKINEVQIVLALATTKEGLPVWYEVFQGNTAETKTLLSSLQDLRQKFIVNDILCVADRAMLSKANIQGLEANGFRYVIGKRLRSMSKTLKNDILSLKDRHDLSKPFCAEFAINKSQRLIVLYSPERANKDKADRKRAINRLKTKIKNNNTSTMSLVNNKAAKKFLAEHTKGVVVIDEEKIHQDSLWDGIYGICTNDYSLSPQKVGEIYKSLWNIEAAFRLSKHDLKMRPIYHWTSDRIKAHCAICFLTHTLAKHLEYRVSLQQEQMSFAKIQEALLAVQASILRHIKTKQLYRIPAKLSNTAKKIYSAFSFKRNTVPATLSK